MKDIIYSAYVAQNWFVLEKILKLYVRPGLRILDATWGRGRFWTKGTHGYTVISNDVDPTSSATYHFDARRTQFLLDSFDAVILDPPYAVKSAGRWGKIYNTDTFDYGTGYGSSDLDNVHLYTDMAIEAARILRSRGILIIKVQDGGSSGRFWKTHFLYNIDGFALDDVFVVIQPGRPVWDPKWKRQLHARKNHSYFFVYRKQ